MTHLMSDDEYPTVDEVREIMLTSDHITWPMGSTRFTRQSHVDVAMKNMSGNFGSWCDFWSCGHQKLVGHIKTEINGVNQVHRGEAGGC